MPPGFEVRIDGDQLTEEGEDGAHQRADRGSRRAGWRSSRRSAPPSTPRSAPPSRSTAARPTSSSAPLPMTRPGRRRRSALVVEALPLARARDRAAVSAGRAARPHPGGAGDDAGVRRAAPRRARSSSPTTSRRSPRCTRSRTSGLRRRSSSRAGSREGLASDVAAASRRELELEPPFDPAAEAERLPRTR